MMMNNLLERAVSRLVEMQSETYLARGHGKADDQ